MSMTLSSIRIAVEMVLLSFAKSKPFALRSEEHTSELQSHVNLVCRLLLEKKNRVLNSLHADAVRPLIQKEFNRRSVDADHQHLTALFNGINPPPLMTSPFSQCPAIVVYHS